MKKPEFREVFYALAREKMDKLSNIETRVYMVDTVNQSGSAGIFGWLGCEITGI